MKLISILGIFVVLLSCCDAYRILGLFPFPARSHLLFNLGVMKALANAGHDVTVYSTMPHEKPLKNYQHYKINGTLKTLGDVDYFKLNSITMVDYMQVVFSFGKEICENILAEPGFKPLMKAKGQFDVVIIEGFFNECFMGFAHAHDVPLIQIASYIGSSWVTDAVGTPTPYAYVSEPYLPFETKMGFIDRFKNTLFGVGVKIARNFMYIPQLDYWMRIHFEDPNMPSIADIEMSTSLLLLNYHETFSYARPSMPNIVNVAGMHIQDGKPLPEHLKKYLDEAKYGAIFLSLGSNIKFSAMAIEKREAFIKAVSKLKQRVIWKWDLKDAFPGKPDNVLLGEWFPQVDILAHPNLQLFITHGGLMSTIEALHKAIPIIGIPIFADQILNMRRIQEKGLGITIEYENVSETSLDWALAEVLKPKYLKTVKRYSAIFHDRERTPQETTVWWVEYVIRNKGAKHLRSPGMELPWYQYYLLDIIGSIFILIYFIFLILKLFYLKFVCSDIKSNRKKVKKN